MVNQLTGFQMLLNYLMKFKTELTPNSCRESLGGEGGEDWVRPALRIEIYRDDSLLLLLGLCKASRALFLRSKLEGATCFAQSGSHLSDSTSKKKRDPLCRGQVVAKAKNLCISPCAKQVAPNPRPPPDQGSPCSYWE